MNFKQIANEIMFELSIEEEDYLNQKYSLFNNNMNKIRCFNLEKYKDLLKEPNELKNGTLRDENEFNGTSDTNVFRNCFSFEDNYVRIKNDK